MRIFASPSRYIQGENALFENAKSILDLGNRPILLCDQLVYDIVGKRFEDYLHRYGFHIVLAQFNGEASDNEINRVVALAEKENCDSIIGLGGGKTIDSAKAIADLIESLLLLLQQLHRPTHLYLLYLLFIQMKVHLIIIYFILKIQI